jgi:hypothetical protein
LTVLPTLSLLETAEFTTLVAFLQGIFSVGTPVVRGYVNRVAEPTNADFAVVWPLRTTRLSTNVPNYVDNVFTASIAGDTMTVTAITEKWGSTGLAPGMQVTDGVAGVVAPDTTVVAQTGGAPGGVGTYTISPTPQNTHIIETMYAGATQRLEPTEWVVQVDLHGPASANNVQVLQSLFRSEYAYDTFESQPTGDAVVPLHADEARFLPFINDQQQVEYRWSIDLHLQVSPIVGTSQQFADDIDVTLYELP